MTPNCNSQRSESTKTGSNCNTHRSESTKLASNCNSRCVESTKFVPNCNTHRPESTKLAPNCNSDRAESTKLAPNCNSCCPESTNSQLTKVLAHLTGLKFPTSQKPEGSKIFKESSGLLRGGQCFIGDWSECINFIGGGHLLDRSASTNQKSGHDVIKKGPATNRQI